MKSKISVIVPCYNQGRFLSETLNSVLEQSFSEWDLIVVDDGSTDDSADIAKSYAAADSRIRYVRQENAGPSAARNKGVSLASAPLLFFLDGDNMILPKFLEIGVEYMESHAECVLFNSRATYFGGKTGEFRLRYTSYQDLLVDNSIDCACIVRREDFCRIGGFDEKLRGYEDWEFFIRLLYHHDTVYQDPRQLFLYRVSDNPGSVNLHAKAHNDEKTMYIYRKHIDKYEEYFGTPFHVTHEYHRLGKELEGILSSRKYKVGKWILAPLAFLKRSFRKY